MPNSIELKSFPNNRSEALAMLYLQNQDLSCKSPSEIHTMYWEVLSEIKKDYKEKKDEGFFKEL